jgi:hypothetical protein
VRSRPESLQLSYGGKASARRRVSSGMKRITIKAVSRGALAGAVGTAAMDIVWYVRYRRGGGEQSFMAWETAEGLDGWAHASAPGLIGKDVIKAVIGEDPPDRWARSTTNMVHWATGMAWGAQLALAAGLTGRRPWQLGLLLGPLAWLTSYTVLPLAKLYKPIWEYDAKTLGKDLSAHLVYGEATGVALAALAA